MSRERPAVEEPSARHDGSGSGAAANPAGSESRELQKTLRILHLEDNPTDAELIERRLHSDGLPFTYECVAIREEFRRALEQFRPDLVLLDYQLPSFDGLSAVRMVRERDSDLPVIIVTGVLGDEAAVGLIKAGANDYVLKDRLARLAPAVEKAVTEAKISRARKHAEEALVVSENRYRSLAAAVAQMVWTTNAQGAVTDDIPAWRAYTGQLFADVQGRGWLNAIHPDDHEQVIADWNRAVSSGLAYQGEWRVRARDGQYRHFSTRAAPILDQKRVIREWIGCNSDITERKQREEEVAALHAKTAEDLKRLESRNREIQSLKELSDTLQACNSREEAYPFIASCASELFPMSSGALATPTEEAPELLETVTHWGRENWMAADFGVEDCWALRRGGLHEPAPGTLCRHFKAGAQVSYACCPLSVRGEVSGLLTVCFPTASPLETDQRLALVAFGDTVALCLANLRLREMLQKQAIRDSLTGVLSSQYLDEMLSWEIQRVEQHHESLSLAILKIDHLKELSDQHGPAVASALISQVAALLLEGRGAFDVVGRHDHEEFRLILIGDDPDAALPRLRKICADIHQRPFSHRGIVLPPITVSAGFAQLPMHGRTAKELLSAARQGLYAARLAGLGHIEVCPVSAVG